MRLLDPPDDALDDTDEEAEYQAWRQRVLARQEQVRQRWASRAGMIRLSDRPRSEARKGLRRSIPTFRDARRLFSLVEERLGDRAVLDPWAAPGERCLLLDDPAHPGWLAPQRFLYLQVRAPQARPPVVPMEVRGDDRLMRFARRLGDELGEALPPAEEEPPVLVSGDGPGVFALHEGPASCSITYGDDGVWSECASSSGDGFGAVDDQPYTIDPYARPPQVPPISLLLRPGLRAEGLALDALADLVVQMDPNAFHRARVHLPCPQPGTWTGAWHRSLPHLRRAAWDGRLPDQDGWVVIDGWNGAALAWGATFDEAVAAWRAQVRAVQPLPPVPPPAQPEPEPEPEPDPDEPARLPPPLPEGQVVLSTGMIELRFEPPCQMDWPAPLPEHVPAVALPLPACPAVPEALAARGFDRALRLFGDHGEVGYTFLRTDPDGWTAVGDDAVEAIDADGLDARLDALREQQAAEYVDHFDRGNPFLVDGPFVVWLRYLVWDDLGRGIELRGGGASWGNEYNPAGWNIGSRHMVMRVRLPQRR